MLKRLVTRAVIAAAVILILAIVAGAGSRTGISLDTFIAAPSDTLDTSTVKAYSDKVIVSINKPRFVSYSDTKSMAPVIGVSTNGIEVEANPEDLDIGDIVSYEANWSEELVTHRIVGEGIDDEGAYYVLKGDANIEEDPGKIRPGQIRYKVVALFY